MTCKREVQYSHVKTFFFFIKKFVHYQTCFSSLFVLILFNGEAYYMYCEHSQAEKKTLQWWFSYMHVRKTEMPL